MALKFERPKWDDLRGKSIWLCRKKFERILLQKRLKISLHILFFFSFSKHSWVYITLLSVSEKGVDGLALLSEGGPTSPPPLADVRM